MSTDMDVRRLPLPSRRMPAALTIPTVLASLLSATVLLLPVDGGLRLCTWAVALLTFGIGAVSSAPSVMDRSGLWAAAYPLSVITGVAILGADNATLGQTYTGLFTIVFVYVGLTMPPGAAVAMTLPATAGWWANNGGFTRHVQGNVLGVRLLIALTLWISIGEILARRVTRTREEHGALTAAVQLDPLTGLQNRHSLTEMFLTSQAGDAFILVDFDHFKAVNDTFGHAAGDAVLTQFGAMINRTLRRGDTGIRYGGEEILLHLRQPGTQLPAVLGRIRETWWRTEPATTYSAGAVLLSGDETPPEAIDRADALLYLAKSRGRNQDVLDQPEPIDWQLPPSDGEPQTIGGASSPDPDQGSR